MAVSAKKIFVTGALTLLSRTNTLNANQYLTIVNVITTITEVLNGHETRQMVVVFYVIWSST